MVLSAAVSITSTHRLEVHFSLSVMTPLRQISAALLIRLGHIRRDLFPVSTNLHNFPFLVSSLQSRMKTTVEESSLPSCRGKDPLKL